MTFREGHPPFRWLSGGVELLLLLRNGNLVDAALVASPFELGREVGVEDGYGFVVGDEAGRKHHDVGVVVAADECPDFGSPGQTGADA